MGNAAPVKELSLAGPLKKHSSFDLDKSGGISPEEAGRISDTSLAQILEEALKPEANSTYNGHHLLFDGLPDRRIASLFASGKANIHYLKNFTEFELPRIPRVMAHLLKENGAKGPLLADQFLLGARVALNQWSGVFDSLRAEYPDYVTSRTCLKYSSLVPNGQRDFGFFDADQSGCVEATEISKLEKHPNPQLVSGFFFAGFRKEDSQLTSHFLLGKAATRFQLLVISGMMARFADLFKMDAKFRRSQEFKEASHFISTKVLIDSKTVADAVNDLGSRDPNLAVLTIALLNEYLSEEAVAALQQAQIEAVQNSFSSQMSQRPSSPDKPFQIEGFSPIKSEADFMDRVLKSKKPVLLVFGASWCPACSKSVPLLKSLAKEYQGGLDIVTLDTVSNEAFAQRFHLDGIPTIMLLSGGKVIEQITGYNEVGWRNLIQQNVPKPEKL